MALVLKYMLEGKTRFTDHLVTIDLTGSFSAWSSLRAVDSLQECPLQDASPNNY